MDGSGLTMGTAAGPGQPLRIGLIGCGNIAVNHHLPAILGMPDRLRVVAVADPTPERLELARDVAGLAADDAYPDPAALLRREDLDIVDLCTPQHIRRELAMAAIDGGRHLLTEKPIATSPADARDIVDAAGGAGVRLGIVHNYLFFPEVIRTLEIVASGEIGPVEVAVLNWLSCADHPGAASYRPRWRHDPRASGGGVLMDMLHIVYLAEAFLGRPIERVAGWLHARAGDALVEDIALARFEADGSAALVNVGWGLGPGGYAVSGPDGRIEVTYRGGGSGAFTPFEQLEVRGRDSGRIERGMASEFGFRGILADFADSIVSGRDPIAPGSQGLHILEATLAVYLSAATGQTVELPLPLDHPVSRLGVAGLADLDLPDWSVVRRSAMFVGAVA